MDFDGTLGDTVGVIVQTMQATIRELELPARTDRECASMIGLRLVDIPSVLFPECELDGEFYAQTYRRLFKLYDKDGAVVLYPNVLETLTELKNRGYVLTIASSRSRTTLVKYIENLGLAPLVSYVLGADNIIVDTDNGALGHVLPMGVRLPEGEIVDADYLARYFEYVWDGYENYVEIMG